MPQMDLDLYLLMRKIKRNKHKSSSQDKVSVGDTDLATVDRITKRNSEHILQVKSERFSALDVR